MQQKIEEEIGKNFASIEKLEVKLETHDCGLGVEILVISNDFEKVSSLKRHQKMQQVLADVDGLNYHKIVLKTYTSAEYKKKLQV